ncbi:TPA: hypothetical protein QIF15_003674 [Escherichia coli]|nr:hypothetical protein [Escherichia coli]
MAKTKQEWLYQLRRCSSVNTLEKIIHKNRDSLSNSERESFNSAADLSWPPEIPDSRCILK